MHMLDKQKITQQAKKIMDNFISALDKVDHKNPDFKIKRDSNIRNDNTHFETNKDFSERMLKNAPEVKNDCIVAERKKW